MNSCKVMSENVSIRLLSFVMLGFNALNPKTRNPKPTIVTVVARSQRERGRDKGTLLRALAE
jgi:hypothetical protein